MRLRYSIVLGTLLLLLTGFITQTGFTQDQSPSESQSQQPTSVLVDNVRTFDGTSEQLSAPSNGLVLGNTIQTISTASILAPTEGNVIRISDDGRGLMLGLIDAHVPPVYGNKLARGSDFGYD